jgi:hypothetical protein
VNGTQPGIDESWTPKEVSMTLFQWGMIRLTNIRIKKRSTKRSTDGTFTPSRYVAVAVSCRPVPGSPTLNQAVRVCTYNGTSFAH